LTITDEAAPADAVAFEDVAFTVAHAEGAVCDRCRRVDPTTAERSYGVTVCDHCADIVETNMSAAVSEGFEKANKKSKSRMRILSFLLVQKKKSETKCLRLRSCWE